MTLYEIALEYNKNIELLKNKIKQLRNLSKQTNDERKKQLYLYKIEHYKVVIKEERDVIESIQNYYIKSGGTDGKENQFRPIIRRNKRSVSLLANRNSGVKLKRCYKGEKGNVKGDEGTVNTEAEGSTVDVLFQRLYGSADK